MKSSTRADLVQRLLWQCVNQRFFDQTGWVWDRAWHYRIPLKKWNKQAWPNTWESAKSSLAPMGCMQLKLTWCLWQWWGRGGWQGARRGEAGAALCLPSRPPPFPWEPALETLVKCMQPWIIQRSCKHKPHNRPELCSSASQQGARVLPGVYSQMSALSAFKIFPFKVVFLCSGPFPAWVCSSKTSKSLSKNLSCVCKN